MKLLTVLTACSLFPLHVQALLHPQESESREVRSLDGVWNFRITPNDADPNLGFTEKWYRKDLPMSSIRSGDVIQMPVPSSYNDITQDRQIRDFIGWAWYDRTFFVPLSWKLKTRVFIRIGSAHYFAKVWVNGKKCLQHAGGHLPFEKDISALLNFGSANRLTLAVNNTLTEHTVPQGSFQWRNESDHYPAGYFTLEYDFDFLNYAGIHRPVLLYTKPKSISIDDIYVTTSVSNDLKKAWIKYKIDVFKVNSNLASKSACMITLEDKDGKRILDHSGLNGTLLVKKPKLWWPYTMRDDPGHLYTLKVHLFDAKLGEDIYRLKIGIRSVDWNSSGIFINHEKFYFRGFGRHEDSDIRGKGLDLPLIAKDFNLIKWTGANSFRTSHYPYSEEIMDFADVNGIVVIEECPAVSIDHFGRDLLHNHKRSISEMIARDKNRPSVVMWSIANEPRSSKPEAKHYFKAVADFTRDQDRTRPVGVVVNADPDKEMASLSVDFVGLNKYASWYSDTGHTELIFRQMVSHVQKWHESRRKPLFVSEYGADTIAGFHQDPSFVFSEEYQTDLMIENFKAFDFLRTQGILCGEMIWNFADFMTKQSYTRVLGNRKGIFTRQRQPKAAAHLMRRRYWSLAQKSPKNDKHTSYCFN